MPSPAAPKTRPARPSDQTTPAVKLADAGDAAAKNKALDRLRQLKLHETATVTLALKNIAMSYPAAGYYGNPRSKKHHCVAEAQAA